MAVRRFRRKDELDAEVTDIAEDASSRPEGSGGHGDP
jgi:hypothetical protein